jgi:hypothetical protein
MKKLVKTARQQFEERLNELKVIDKETTGGNFTYYLCEDDSSRCIILERGEDTFPIYSEITMPGTLLDVYTDEDFLASLVNYWIEDIQEPLKRLFDWYASADKENPPFGIQTMAQLSRNASSETFSDIYEEVPDVRIITAKEQWEEDSKSAKVLCSSTEKTLKVYVSSSQVVFYDSEDIYSRSIFPSLEVMRNDALFVGRLTESMSEANMYDDIAIFLRWVRTGGDFPLPLSVIYHSEYSNYKFEDYEDKDLSQEQSITKKDFSTEITDLKERMIKHIEELHKQGMTLDSDSFLENAYSITWSDGSYYACENLISCKLTKSDNGVLCFSEIQVNDKDVTYDSPLSMLTINTLWSIIDAMR